MAIWQQRVVNRASRLFSFHPIYDVSKTNKSCLIESLGYSREEKTNQKGEGGEREDGDFKRKLRRRSQQQDKRDNKEALFLWEERVRREGKGWYYTEDEQRKERITRPKEKREKGRKREGGGKGEKVLQDSFWFNRNVKITSSLKSRKEVKKLRTWELEEESGRWNFQNSFDRFEDFDLLW